MQCPRRLQSNDASAATGFERSGWPVGDADAALSAIATAGFVAGVEALIRGSSPR